MQIKICMLVCNLRPVEDSRLSTYNTVPKHNWLNVCGVPIPLFAFSDFKYNVHLSICIILST